MADILVLMYYLTFSAKLQGTKLGIPVTFTHRDADFEGTFVTF